MTMVPLTAQKQPNQERQQDAGLVSVIIPNYNHAAYLGAAIQSVLDQSYRQVEIIVVDDGSTDNSREVVARFGDQVRYIWQTNQGLSAARNSGIRAAKGSYIALLDADDLYETAFLQTLVATLAATPTADGIYCGYQFVDEQNRLLPQREARLISVDRLYAALAEGNFLVPEAMLLRHVCYEQVGAFDETLSACEDWDMWLRVTKSFNIIGASQVLTRHRILPSSMSTDPTRMFTNRLAVLQKHFGPATADGNQENSLKQRAYGRTYLISGVEYLQFRDLGRVYSCLREMAHLCPALLLELDTFYQLGCGSQPKGSLGHFHSLDLAGNAQTLFALLDRLFAEPALAVQLIPYRRRAYAYAYLALGLLSYGAQRYGLTRHFLLRGIAAGFHHGLNGRALVTLLKALPGVNQLVKQRLKLMQGNLS